jgi:competence ComEA-like helix-hairpin-helix protein
MLFKFRVPHFIRLARARLPRFHLPVLTASEKFALLTLTALLAGGAALRIWERSGVRIGPVEDWETLRQLVIRAKADLKNTEGEVDFACADDAAAGSFGARDGSGPDIVAAGFGGAGGGKKRAAADSRKKVPPRPVDLNTAGEKALLTLPGIGPSTVKAILAHRAANGKFRSVDDLLQVKGIGPKKLEALRPFARVENTEGQAEKTETPPINPGD